MEAEDRLAELYDAHGQALYAFLLQLTHSGDDAADLLQEVFLKVARRLDRFTNLANPRSYLFATAHRGWIDHHRRQQSQERRQQAHAQETSSLFIDPATLEEAEYAREVSLALGQLPPEQRVVLHLKIWEELTFAEISTALQISPHTAASRYRYALDKLKTLLRSSQESSYGST